MMVTGVGAMTLDYRMKLLGLSGGSGNLREQRTIGETISATNTNTNGGDDEGGSIFKQLLDCVQRCREISSQTL